MEAQIETTPVTPPAPVSPDASPPPEAPASTQTAPVEPTAEEIAEQRVLRIAREKQALRKDKTQHKEILSAGEVKRKADALRAEGKYVEALEVLGYDPDDFYVKATDQIHARTKVQQDPDAVIAAKVEQKLKERDDTAASQAIEAQHNQWKENAVKMLETSADEFPAVVRALAVGRFTQADLLKYAVALQARGENSSPSEVYKAVEAHINPPKAEAPKGTPAGAPPSTLTSNVTPTTPVDLDNLPLEEALALAKAKYLK